VRSNAKPSRLQRSSAFVEPPNLIERPKVNSPIDPGDDRFDETASQLDAGLRTCRAVVSNYRSLLVGDGAELERQPAGTHDWREDSPN
jgi:hypothetical protein